MVSVIIILLVSGCMLILASFIFGGSMKGSGSGIMSEQEIEQLVERRFSEVKYRLDDEAEKSADIIREQTERELEKLSNEKIMAVNEYSDQVMNQINKNHSEVMFLYSMLSDKQKELDHAVERLNHVKQEAANEEQLARHRQRRNVPGETAQAQEGGGESGTVSAAAKGQPSAAGREEGTRRAGQNAEPERRRQDRKPVPDGAEAYDNKERILLMHAEGRSAREIAQKLHMGVGEVRLVLELSKERQR